MTEKIDEAPGARRVVFETERVSYSGGRSFPTGRSRVTEAPCDVVLVTEAGRVIEVGDMIGRGEVLCAIPRARVEAFARGGWASSPVVSPVLFVVASALFGWLP